MIELENAIVYHGSNLDVLPTLPDNSVDSIVTDPPYELGFMGKSWDSSGIAYSVELWQECMRVLKPGGHLLAFGGSRTWHRLAVAIEDAGFEMRDSIAWLYGSGFPKSLDVSKAIDKNNGKPQPTSEFKQFLRAGKASVNLTSDQIDKALGFTSAVFSPHYVGNNSQVEYPTKEKYKSLKQVLNLDDSFDYLIEWAEAKREVIGQNPNIERAAKSLGGEIGFGAGSLNSDITAPATPEALKWQGWGTALKPAFEPVVVARKPLIGTVAQNVLTYGTGGLNIDGSRVEISDKSNGFRSGNYTSKNDSATSWEHRENGDSYRKEQHPQGRWPANIILDPYTAELLDEQAPKTGSKGTDFTGIGDGLTSNVFSENGWTKQGKTQGVDIGGASRFFYVAKASKRDRNEGLEGLEGKEIGAKGNGLARACATCGATVLDGCDCPDRTFVNPTRQNFHPTVKPTSLMEYLIKLVTPEGGTVLDPFTGSGSTGKAALLNGFQFIGIELTEEYLPIIEGRLRWANEQRNQDASQSDKEEKETLF